MEKIEQIAKSHNLKVIYDAAHCFGVKYKNQSIFNYGDISTCSFHATKLFHTAEGGAIFCKDEALRHKLFYSHNFGHDGPVNFFGLGINGKISELHAAMGLSVLPYVSSIINSRKKIIEIYNSCLKFRNFRNMLLRNELEWNYSYYPIIFNNEDDLLNIQNKLNQNNIFPRRYFYPSLNKLPFVTASSKPISEKISSSILCLPLFFDLSERDQIKICQIINS